MATAFCAAGAKAIAVDEIGPSEEEAARRSDNPIVSVDLKPEPRLDLAALIDEGADRTAPTPMSPRGGTKIAQVIGLLQRGDGATLAELVAMTGWLPHTTRAALTGLRKRGYAVSIDRANKERGSVYRVELTKVREESAASMVEAAPSEAPSDRPRRIASPRTRRAA